MMLTTAEGTDECKDEKWREKAEEEEEKKRKKEEEEVVLRRQVAGPDTWLNSVRFLMERTDAFDGIVLGASAVAAVIGGAAIPFSMLLLGNTGQSFRDFFVGDNSQTHFTHGINQLCLYYVYLAVAQFVAIYVATVGFTMAGERITQRIREAYLAAVLRQNIAYFESIGVGEVNTRLTADVNLIQDAITGKAATTLTAIATFISAIIINFVKSWRLSLVVLPALLLIVASMSIGATFMVKYTTQAIGASTLGASIAEEAIGSIRTVAAFGMQSKLVRQYSIHLQAARKSSTKSGIALAWMLGALNSIIFWSYGLAFWQGSRWLVHDQVTLSAILTILFASIVGAFALGNVSPHAQAFVNGITATEKISQTISRRSPVDPSDVEGHKIADIKGSVELRNVRHIYPSRPDTLILDEVSHHFQPGKMTAIVGPSGCGKSTIVGLLERFYLPTGGAIYIDGHDISNLNVSWLRQQIGFVSQEPILFSVSVFENIRYGLIGSELEHSSAVEIQSIIEKAAKVANAYEFIMGLPEEFMTKVGDSGSLLSGGQKQRIAIARAIVSNPKILILDEATSALDTNSERQVQIALREAARGRTTIAIAHRLSTIRDAENILVMSKGRIIEHGTHDELMSQRSVYAGMVSNQTIEFEASAEPLIEDGRLPNIDSEKGPMSAEEAVTSDGDFKKREDDTIQPPEASSSTWTLARFVYGLNKDDDLLIIGGLAFSILAGSSYPTQSVFLAKIIAAMSLRPSMYALLRSRVNFWCWMYLMIGFTTLIGWLGQSTCFAYYSQRLTHKAREKGLDTILHHDMAAFLREDHSTGSLTSVLSSSASSVQGLSGVVLGTILVVLTQLTAGFVVAAAIGWKLALVCFSTVPIQIGCGILRLKCLSLLESHSRRIYESSANYACEYSANIRTVAPLTLERKIQQDYHEILETQRKKSLVSVTHSSLLYAASQSLNLLCVALAFWYGSRLVVTDGYSLFQFFLCYTAVIAGAYSAGAIFSFAPDIGKAKDAAQAIKNLFSRPIDIDARSDRGALPTRIDGTIHFQDVSFCYPNRARHLVLDRVSLQVQPGQYVAVVGASGSGKSTIVSLLERFFDPTDGHVMVDGMDLRNWNVKNYRGHIALVSQTPTLFDGTIRENIVLGVEDDDNVAEGDIARACRDANILDFINSLPDGFHTRVGARGAMLSGGQKQRIAIARALIRSPQILLLDEATSALDSESERVVQAALDAASKGRTTIAIAHRISTVEKADRIYVLDHGRIVEQGTHQTLMGLNGKYKELVTLQSLGDAPA